MTKIPYHRSQWLAVFLLASLATLGAPTARADGCAMPAFERGEVEMSDQRALIYHDGKEETLVIDTAIKTDGQQGDYAWVVPLPSKPTLVEPASEGLFPTVQSLCAPEVQVRRGEQFWPFAIGLGMFTACVMLALHCRDRQRDKTRVGMTLAVIVMLFLIFAAILLPSLGAARRLARGVDDDGVEILQHEILGAYDTAVLSSPDGQALNDWLSKHGYKIPAMAGPVISQLAKEGWCFVAMRLAKGSAVHPHPMAFRFPADKAIYPMRLTGVAQTSPLRVDLFVLGDSAAEADGLGDKAVLQVVRPSDAELAKLQEQSMYAFQFGRKEFPLCHPELRRLVPEAKRFTLLHGTVPASDMDHDIILHWHNRRPHAQDFVTPAVAALIAMDFAIPCLTLGLLTSLFFLMRQRKPIAWNILLAGVVLSLLAFGGIYILQSKAEGTGERVRTSRWHFRDHRDLLYACESFNPPPTLVSASDIRLAFARHADESPRDDADLPTIQGDIPYGWQIKDSPAAIQICVYDRAGTEFVAWKREKNASP